MPLLHTAHLTCREDAVDVFKERLLRHARTTLAAERGCERFDVHQSKDDPALFFLFEVYADQAALDAHRVAPHYLQFRSDTADWVIDRKWWFWEETVTGDEKAVTGEAVTDAWYLPTEFCSVLRVGEDVAALTPHRPGRAQFTHPVLHCRSFAYARV